MNPARAQTYAELAARATDLATAELYADLADHLTRPATLAEQALAYAQAGLMVFRLSAGSKVPLAGSRGLHDGSCDVGRIASLWRQMPQANIGLATGHKVDVVDLDGPEGAIWWAHLEVADPTAELAPGIPVLGTVSTPRGTHIYIPATGRGNRAAMAPQVDYRGLGGYVVAPPSVVAGVTYRWRRPLKDLP